MIDLFKLHFAGSSFSRGRPLDPLWCVSLHTSISIKQLGELRNTVIAARNQSILRRITLSCLSMSTRLKEFFAKSILSVVRSMKFAPLIVMTSPILYVDTGLRVKRGGVNLSFVRQGQYGHYIGS